MEYKYYVCFHDIKNNEITVLKTYKNKYTAINFLENFINDYIYKKEGDKIYKIDNKGNKTLKIYHKNDHNRPNGYFVEKDHQYINSLLIRKKTKRNMVFNSLIGAHFEDICKVFLIKKKIKKIKKNPELFESNNIYYYCEDRTLSDQYNYSKEIYDNVIKELNTINNKFNMKNLKIYTDYIIKDEKKTKK